MIFLNSLNHLKTIKRDDLQNNIDRKMLCFSALTAPSKNKKQRLAEEQKQKRWSYVGEDGTVQFGEIPDPRMNQEGESEESEDDEDDDEDEV